MSRGIKTALNACGGKGEGNAQGQRVSGSTEVTHGEGSLTVTLPPLCFGVWFGVPLQISVKSFPLNFENAKTHMGKMLIKVTAHISISNDLF